MLTGVQTTTLTIARQLGSLTKKVADYEKLLRDLATRASDVDSKLIKTALEKVSQTSDLRY